MPPPLVTCEPVTAVKVLVLAVPIDTPPEIVPVLRNVFPVAELSNATRPVRAPLFVILTCPPPCTATTGVSDVNSDRPSKEEEPMTPLLTIVVVPPAPLVAFRAMPSSEARFSPSNAPVPRMMPVALLVMFNTLAAVLPITTPPLNTETNPRSAGSMVPELFNVVLLPVRVSALPPSVALSCAPALTLTVRLLTALLKVLRNNGNDGTPVQVTVAPTVGLAGLQAANTSGLTRPITSPATPRRIARESAEIRGKAAVASLLSTFYSLWSKPFIRDCVQALFQRSTRIEFETPDRGDY